MQGLSYSNYGHYSNVSFSDVDWAGSPINRRSTKDYCVVIGWDLMPWKSKKQSVVYYQARIPCNGIFDMYIGVGSIGAWFHFKITYEVILWGCLVRGRSEEVKK